MRVLRIVLLFLCCLLCFSCRTVRCSTERQRTLIQKDTVYHNTIQKDSVFFHDSVFVMQNGDTTIYKEYHIAYKMQGKTDTIRVYKLIQDTLYNTKVETEYKEKEESWWSKTMRRIGIASCLLLILMLALWVYRKWDTIKGMIH